MGIYYKLVNTTKKEYINIGKIGMSLKSQSYKIEARSMLGYLMMTEYPDYVYDESQYNEEEYKNNVKNEDGDFYFLAHWHGDRVRLASEHTDEYGLATGYLKFDKKENEIREVGIDENDYINEYVDITIPLAKEMNYYIKYWWPEDKEAYEKHGIKNLNTDKYIE